MNSIRDTVKDIVKSHLARIDIDENVAYELACDIADAIFDAFDIPETTQDKPFDYNRIIVTGRTYRNSIKPFKKKGKK